MELLCPLCQNKLTIDDKYAGQLLKCQMCSGMFQAPTLPDIPTASPPPTPPPPPPVSPPASFKLDEPAAPAAASAPSPAAAGPSAAASPPPGAPPPETAAASSTPLPPLAEGYTHLYILTFNQKIISWVAVVSLALIFFLSFFSWTVSSQQPQRRATNKKKVEDSGKETAAEAPAAAPLATGLVMDSMWSVTFVVYNIFYFFTLIFAVLALLLDKKIVSLPPGLKKVRPWRSLIVAGLAAIGMFALLFQWASTLNFSTSNPNTAIFSLVMFLQLLVLVAPLLEYWLQQRKKDELPVPRIEMRW